MKAVNNNNDNAAANVNADSIAHLLLSMALVELTKQNDPQHENLISAMNAELRDYSPSLSARAFGNFVAGKNTNVVAFSNPIPEPE